ncbi:WD40 repeat-like protein [Auriculariales sp. MPI-PUGE-AT-0066]|nr:WD40 repeat-like protein [Auriculariales sp. MPI-PUGE-AT-0066]
MDPLSVILVTGSYDHEIRFWEAGSGICSRTIARGGEPGQVNRLAISSDKRLLAAAIHKKVKIYLVQGAENTPVTTFDGHSANVTALQFQIEGKWLATASEDCTIRVWDMRTKHQHRTYDNGAPVNDLQIHPNQAELVSCDQEGCVKTWDLTTNTCTASLNPAGDVPIRSVSVAADASCLVAANNKGRVFVWKMHEGPSQPAQPRFQAVTRFTAHARFITRLILSPDRKYLATCSADATIKIWKVSSNWEFILDKTLTGHQRWVWDAAWSTDSAYLVTASSDHVARLWDVSAGDTVRAYNGHHKACVCVALADHTPT